MSTDHDSSDSLLSRIAAAKKAVLGQRARLEADLGRVASDWKADGSRVTETDHAISEAILGELIATFPEDIGLSEELMTDQPIEVSSRFAWVLDPIDGTNNFATGLAQCAISLALFEHGEPVYGVIYDASRRRLMHGGPGFGMWDGETQTTVRTRELSRTSVIGFHSPHEASKYPHHGDAVVRQCKVRALGSSALHLAYVAAGLFDGTVDHNVKLWDIAAGIPMVRAAGGQVTFLANNPLPLRRFDLDMPRILYVGGSAAVCASLAEILTEADAPGC
ncbi:inositol monophosphatase family protein [Synoicihabitans lomoniglobus]|uniref:Inositol monophosphatase n=1 Tax=Synoicihabitans lomoniglobus TaxID=2909285 RepID=A0AAF0CR43_9BACT|nr:inositol monophosphatase [Opitutaceae bacterium LMO-M01]WED66441.1 inositol monophosphatase [Opitutaceae bacterium LMO-M01]